METTKRHRIFATLLLLSFAAAAAAERALPGLLVGLGVPADDPAFRE